MSTTFDGPVGLAMKWDFGVLPVNKPANVTIAMGFAENRTVLTHHANAVREQPLPEYLDSRITILFLVYWIRQLWLW